MQDEKIDEQKKSSGKIIGIICILVAVLIAGYLFRNTLFKKSVVQNTPVQNASSTTFSPALEDAINRFIFTKIDALSPVPAATGTAFVVSSIETSGPGERVVVYTDSTATYTAKAVFAVPEPKKINIVSFDLIPAPTP